MFFHFLPTEHVQGCGAVVDEEPNTFRKYRVIRRVVGAGLPTRGKNARMESIAPAFSVEDGQKITSGLRPRSPLVRLASRVYTRHQPRTTTVEKGLLRVHCGTFRDLVSMRRNNWGINQ